MAVCCYSLAGTAACQHCSQNPFATDVWTNKTVTVDHAAWEKIIDAKPFGNGIDVCPVCGKPSTIGKPITNADRIRSMTDEELSYYLDGLAGDGCPPQMVCNKERYKCNVRKCWLEWLKQEATDVS